MSNEDLKDLLAHVAASAKQVNIMTGDHAQAVYNEAGAKESDNKATDEQIFRAITAINGKNKILKHQQAFLGICCYLASMQKWPNNLEACASRVANLDKSGEWYCACKWESIRKFSQDMASHSPIIKSGMISSLIVRRQNYSQNVEM